LTIGVAETAAPNRVSVKCGGIKKRGKNTLEGRKRLNKRFHMNLGETQTPPARETEMQKIPGETSAEIIWKLITPGDVL